MLENSSNHQPPRRHRVMRALGVPAWFLFGFAVAVIAVGELVRALDALGVNLRGIGDTLFTTLVAAATYLVTLAIVIGVPRAWRRSVTRTDLGVQRLPNWADIGLAPVTFLVYMIATTIVGYLAQRYIPGFDSNEVQETGFTSLTQTYQLVLAFITLVIMAPLAEELLFRGYLYGRLRHYAPIWVSMLLTSVVFGFVHGQWNVGLDVFVLSLALTGLREYTGSIWAGVLVHMIKNGLAFYLLFINPSFLLH